MDTISRDNNTSYLPVAGVIVGLLALVLSAVALVKVSSTGKTLAAHDEKVAKIDNIEATANSAASSASTAQKGLTQLGQETQRAVTQLNDMIVEANGKIVVIQDSMKKPAATAKGGGPVVAGPGEYVIKAGDSFAKIARAQGFNPADIAAVNPGIESSKLKIGQKIKLPKK